MRGFAVCAAAALLCACSSGSPRLRPLYAAEGERHVAVLFEVDLDSRADADSIAAFAADIAQVHGNIATYVLQTGTDRLTIFTVWESHEDLIAWQKRSHTNGAEHPVLVELTR